MKRSIHVCKVKEKLDRTSPPRRSESFASASLSLANLMSCPCDKSISFKTHVIVGLLKTGY